MPAMTMVCFANSRKLNGRCIAGLAWDGRNYAKWVRPISSHGRGELTYERFYAASGEPRLLDVIDLELGQPRPSGCHVEDVLVNADEEWRKRGAIPFKEAVHLASSPKAPLWVDGNRSSNGLNDKIDASVADALTSSLRLVVPNFLTMTATLEWEKRRVRGKFSLDSSSYILSVTDLVIESEFSNYPVGYRRTIEKPILCLSISEVFEAQNACYKLIAGVVEG